MEEARAIGEPRSRLRRVLLVGYAYRFFPVRALRLPLSHRINISVSFAFAIGAAYGRRSLSKSRISTSSFSCAGMAAGGLVSDGAAFKRLIMRTRMNTQNATMRKSST